MFEEVIMIKVVSGLFSVAMVAVQECWCHDDI